MNGLLRWFRGLREPVFVPGPPPLTEQEKRDAYEAGAAAARAANARRTHIVHAPHMTECECGRQHPDGWVCAASIGGHS